MICISALNKTVHSIYFSWKCLINSCLLQVERNCYYSSSFCSKNFGTGPRRMSSKAMSKKRKIFWIEIPLLIYSFTSVCSFFSKWRWQLRGCNWWILQKRRRAWKYIGYIGIFWKYIGYNGNIHSFDLYHIMDSIKLVQTKAIYYFLFLVLCLCCFSQLSVVLCPSIKSCSILYQLWFTWFIVNWNIVVKGLFRRILSWEVTFVQLRL